ncbi:MAG: phosphoribosyltransferase family protein [Bacteroidia bacterium]|nr:phosphoribosyltransferase family protein [Bacteroidia bacterium]
MEAYARFLWEAQIIQIRTAPPWFQWVSGIQSPIYADHRRLLSYPYWRRWVIQALTERLKIRLPSFKAVVGVATGGIAWAAWLGEALELPVGYVRAQPKSHGLGRQVEGLSEPVPVLLIEDLISTGESLRRAAFSLQAEGFPVIAAAALWSYELPFTASFPQPTLALLTFPQALWYWTKANLLSPEEALLLRQWHRSLTLPLS